MALDTDPIEWYRDAMKTREPGKGFDSWPEWLSPELCSSLGIYGRVSLEQKTPSRLANDPKRKTVFVFGPESIEKTIFKLSPADALHKFGLTKEYITHKIKREHCAAFIILYRVPSTEDVVRPATRDGVLQTVKRHYTDVAVEIEDWIRDYHADPTYHSVEACEARLGVRFIDVHTGKTTTLPKLTYDVYVAMPRPLPSSDYVRLFLYNELRLFELFAGDGFTKDEEGRVGDREFISDNMELSSFADHVVVDVSADFKSFNE